MSWILGYACNSSAGGTTDEFWSALKDGRTHSHAVDPARWSAAPGLMIPLSACLWPSSDSRAVQTAKECLVSQLLNVWMQTLNGLDDVTRAQVLKPGDLGVIFASTKGCIDDFIFKDDPPEIASDPLTPILDSFLSAANLDTPERICVSTACTSSLSALFLARSWLASKRARHVLILAGDRIGPFTLRGFQVLNVLTPDAIQPFAKSRSGFHLGDAAAAILVSAESFGSNLRLAGAALDTEGYALTRPSQSGDSLSRAITQLGTEAPSLIVAHGTATLVNDAIEDKAFSASFHKSKRRPLITGTKWSIGHTLGASGAMDTIAACEILRRQETFSLATTADVDRDFRCRYLVHDSEPDDLDSIESILVSSLGFGGIHAAAKIEIDHAGLP